MVNSQLPIYVNIFMKRFSFFKFYLVVLTSFNVNIFEICVNEEMNYFLTPTGNLVLNLYTDMHSLVCAAVFDVIKLPSFIVYKVTVNFMLLDY